MNSKHENKLLVFEMVALKRMLGVLCKIAMLIFEKEWELKKF